MAVEFGRQQVRFEREMKMTIYYEDVAIGNRRIDFFVEDKIMVERDPVAKLDDLHLSQALNNLEAYNLPAGLLINFGSRSLEFKRVYSTKHPDNQSYISYES